MLDDTLARLEAEMGKAGVSPEKKAELLQLMSTLREEITRLPAAHANKAKSIAGFAEVSAHEATRPKRRPELLELSLAGLEKSVEEFEATHPRLVEIAGSLSNALANVGLWSRPRRHTVASQGCCSRGFPAGRE